MMMMMITLFLYSFCLTFFATSVRHVLLPSLLSLFRFLLTLLELLYFKLLFIYLCHRLLSAWIHHFIASFRAFTFLSLIYLPLRLFTVLG